VSVVSGEASSEQQAADYVVGQVSGSLFQKNAAAPGSLSTLFSTAAPAASLLFQPAPEVNTLKTFICDSVSSHVSPSSSSSAAGFRESGLQEADDDERGQETSVKKKKRKRKASELGGEKDVEHWVMKRQRLKASREEEAVKSKRTVFVGNLPISCTKKVMLSSCVREDPSMSRKVAAIKRQIHPKKQSVNAYVVFKDEEGVAKALERNGLEIEKDFHIRVDRVTDSSAHDHKRSVFVGNLSFEINELAFRRHFEECGPVEAVRLVRDQNSGLGKGFGYVLFESADSVQLALELDGSKLEGRSIRVKRSVKKEKQKNKTNNTGPAARTGRGPTKGPTKGPVKGRSQRKFTGKQQRSTKSSGSFKGEMVDPNKKTKKKGLKKKVKHCKHTCHL
uniref:RNA binding motif protein 34 n=1 Tax=Seriola lalandi dorsalis TaxID=1841481 RepID=A0A3B4WHM7_SERLL